MKNKRNHKEESNKTYNPAMLSMGIMYPEDDLTNNHCKNEDKNEHVTIKDYIKLILLILTPIILTLIIYLLCNFITVLH